MNKNLLILKSAAKSYKNKVEGQIMELKEDNKPATNSGTNSGSLTEAT